MKKGEIPIQGAGRYGNYPLFFDDTNLNILGGLITQLNIQIGNIRITNVDGTAGQVLTTDGAGNVTFQNTVLPNLFNGTISFNPTITCYFALTPIISTPFQVADVVTDNAGNTGVILTTDGTTTMTLTDLIPSGSKPATFSGGITGSVSGAAGVVDSFDWGDQTIDMSAFGNYFIDLNVFLTNLQGGDKPPVAGDFEIWDALGRTGNQLFVSTTTPGSGNDALASLSQEQYIQGVENGNADLIFVPTTKIWIASTLYVTFGTPEGVSETAQLIINGQVIN